MGKRIVLKRLEIIKIFLVLSFCPGISFAEYSDETRKNKINTDEIIVTAQKQEEHLKDVPISISVLGDVDIEDKQIADVGDIADHIPNLSVFNVGSSGANIAITRGISSSVMESLTVSTGLFIDGVPILNPNGFEYEIIDVERVEVLRGPQGTLYGKGTEVGAVNIISRKPGNEFRGKATIQVGAMLSSESDENNFGSIAVNLSGPIKKDKLLFGLTGKYYEKDGFIKDAATGDDVNNKKYWVGRMNLQYNPTDKLDVSIVASNLVRDDGGNDLGLGAKGRNDYMAFLSMLGNPYVIPVPEKRKINSDLESDSSENTRFQSLKIEYDFSDKIKLTSVSTNWNYERDALFDWDFTPLTLWHSDQFFDFNHQSQELRLDYTGDRVKTLFGIYYGQLDNTVDFEVKSIFPGMAGFTDRTITGQTWAAFTNVKFNLTDKMSIIAGLRYEKEEQEFEDKIKDSKVDDSWFSVTPKLALEYKLTPKVMSYASISSGQRPGGFNVRTQNPDYLKYDEETLWSYEAGLKGSFFDGNLAFNCAGFYMDIQEMQVNTATSQNETYLSNAGEASGFGGEFDFTAKLSRSLLINGGFGYVDLEFDKYRDDKGDYKGNKNPYAPEYTFNLGAKYRALNGFYAGVDLIGYGEMYIDKENKYSQGAYSIVNSKLGYEKGNFDIYLYAKNLFDEGYNTEGYYDGTLVKYSEPGEIGLSFSARF